METLKLKNITRHCGYCQQEFPTDRDAINHGQSCESNPLVGQIAQQQKEMAELRAENARLRAALAPFAAIGKTIVHNWPGECRLRIISEDGREGYSYHGESDEHLGVLPTLNEWRQAAEEASRRGGKPMSTPEDHPVLDWIDARLHDCGNVTDVRRKPKCIEFFDEKGSGGFFQIVVRPIDMDAEDWERVGYPKPVDTPQERGTVSKPRPQYRIDRKCPDLLEWQPVPFTEAQSLQYCRGWVEAMDSLYPSPPYRIVKITGDTQIILRQTTGRAAPHVN